MAYRSGEHKIVCDRCGFDKLRSQCKYEWNNLLVCNSCWEPKHPQLDIRVTVESTVRDLRPEGTDVYLVDTSTWGALRDANGNVLYDSEGKPLMPKIG